MTNTPFTDWHKTLLWFLGAVALIAVAGPAPNIATMIVVILIVGVLLGHWSTSYAPFFNLTGVANPQLGNVSQGGAK